MSIASAKGPLGLKAPRAAKANGVRKVSKKRAAHMASKAGKAELAHMAGVKQQACIACGKPGPSDAHHCRDIPPESELDVYTRLPAAGRKSGGKDTIPLCKGCHLAYHMNKRLWNAQHGPDYGYLPLVRTMLDEQDTIDF